MKTREFIDSIPKVVKSRTGLWKWIRFKDGYCMFEPRVLINGARVIPQKIYVKNSNEMMNECIGKYGNELLPFTWIVNGNNEAIVDDTLMSRLDKIVARFMQLEYEEFKKNYGDSWLRLDWKDVKKDFDTYTIQPNLECPKIKPIMIQGDLFSPSVNELIKYRSQLPAVQYKISEDFKIFQFDYNEFYEALDICKEILIKKYGEQWMEKRKEKKGMGK